MHAAASPLDIKAMSTVTRSTKVLHYIYDPLCGWCYAAEALADAAIARDAEGFEVQLHAGGLFARTQLSEAKRDMIRNADARIGAMTGQVFGDAYLNGLLSDPNTVYDSAQPIRAVLAAEELQAGSAPAMLKALQRAHYREGRRIVEEPTLVAVAESIGLEPAAFNAALADVDETELSQHLHSTHALMQQVGARGYPSFVAEVEGQWALLPHDRFYGHAADFADLVSSAFE